MPLYDYEILDAQGKPTGEVFEDFQKMADAAHTRDPQTGRPCRRKVTTFNTANTVLMGEDAESLREQWLPSEVKKVQRAFGEDLGNCINPSTGNVTFNDGRQRDRYYKKRRDLIASGQIDP